MIKACCLLIAFISFLGCTPKQNKVLYESERLTITEINPHLFVHTSQLKTTSYGQVACNGMVYFNKGKAIVFDTPTDDAASLELIHWIQQQQQHIDAVAVTHFHVDCLGGLDAFHNKGIRSYASNRTINLLKLNQEKRIPQIGFDQKTTIKIGDTLVNLAFYGEGHTTDNIVGYIPKEKALFGGCLIKTLKAKKGFLGDANVTAWPSTVTKLKSDLPGLTIVVPGHGSYGGIELLEYTINLFQE